MQMLFLALTRCKDQVTGSIGCSHYGAGEFTWGNPWDLPRKLRLVPAAKDEAGFPQPSRPAAAASPVALALLWCWAGLVPVSAAALPGVWGEGGSSPASLAVILVPHPASAHGCNRAPLSAAFPVPRNDEQSVQNYLCQSKVGGEK